MGKQAGDTAIAVQERVNPQQAVMAGTDSHNPLEL